MQTHSNYSSMELVLPIQFTKKNPSKTTQMDANMITVNNFLGNWTRRYPDNTRILPTNNNVDIYQFSASQLKYLPRNAISIIEKKCYFILKKQFI